MKLIVGFLYVSPHYSCTLYACRASLRLEHVEKKIIDFHTTADNPATEQQQQCGGGDPATCSSTHYSAGHKLRPVLTHLCSCGLPDSLLLPLLVDALLQHPRNCVWTFGKFFRYIIQL